MQRRDSDSSKLANGENVPKPAKAPYAKPVLKIYGSVSKLTMGTGGTKADTTNKTKTNSDRRLKQDIVRIGDHPLGIGVYLFQYRPEYRGRSGHGTRFGLMADEVAGVVPEAVSVCPRGYQVVDYSMLGVFPAAG